MGDSDSCGVTASKRPFGTSRRSFDRWTRVGRRLQWVLVTVATLALPSIAEAQRSLVTYPESRRTQAIRSGFPDAPGGFTFCRLQYTSVRNFPRGLGWGTDYPGGDHNLTLRLAELTTTWISRWSNEDPGMAVVRPTDPELFRCPFLFASDVGTASFTEAEAEVLREYLMKGGFLWVDDFWGNTAWRYWEEQVRTILPDREIVDVRMDHPLMSVVYEVEKVPQIPSMQFWHQSGGVTSELGAESDLPGLRGVFDDEGRLLMLMSHNTDVADGWEREMDDDAFFQLFSPDAYAVGINVLVWVMTH